MNEKRNFKGRERERGREIVEGGKTSSKKM
jgi:hypothetical protein